jgi:hypothetical protein
VRGPAAVALATTVPAEAPSNHPLPIVPVVVGLVIVGGLALLGVQRHKHTG